MTSMIKVSVINTKITKNFVLLRFNTKLRVSKDDEKFIICDSSLIFLNFKNLPVPNTDHESKAWPTTP